MKKIVSVASLLVLLAVVAVLWQIATPQGMEAVCAQDEYPYKIFFPTLQGGCEMEIEVPFLNEWTTSGHADATSESFTHWDDEGEISTSCAKCHSTHGYRDFLGADGSAVGVVDEAAALGSTVECLACHNDMTTAMISVTMPSGITITDLGAESRCMQCHQGRASGPGLDEAIAGIGDDVVSTTLGFMNIHYHAAAATQYGTLAMGGYQYEGKSYDAKFAHVDEFGTCMECHDSHTLELRVDDCAACHTETNLKDIRTVGSVADYDGDGLEEGIYGEIETLKDELYLAIQAYPSTTISVTNIVYTSTSYPYFFVDTNGDGIADPEEANYGNKYNTWTPRLLKAAYNYQVAMKDHGGYAHGGKYMIQLLYDSIEDVGGNVSSLNRNDAGHFDGSAEAFRHWDDDEDVSGSCSRCHSATGLPFYLEVGVDVSAPQANGLQCVTCHEAVPATGDNVRKVDDVEFPSGEVIDSDAGNTNLCLNCHQGRNSTVDVNDEIEAAGVGADTVVTSTYTLGFVNVHYFPAGATLMGTDAKGAYEYDGMMYTGVFTHSIGPNDCAGCHDEHELSVDAASCVGCHAESGGDLHMIRKDMTDYDGDTATEGIAGEVETMHDALYAAIQAYSSGGTLNLAKIVYDSHSYPYFFIDTNDNGIADPEEANYGNRYSSWTPRLLKAAYNYQYVAKEPGAFAHNAKYVIQALYDSIEDLGGDVTSMTRPVVVP